MLFGENARAKRTDAKLYENLCWGAHGGERKEILR